MPGVRSGTQAARAAAVPRQRAQLTRARVLSSALELVDQDGLDALTMRRLAERLDIDPMSLYSRVAGKDALLDGLAEALWAEVRIPRADLAWKEALRMLALELRSLARAHPHAYNLLCGRGVLPEPALRVIDSSLTTLERAGLGRTQAAEMIRTLIAYAAGYGMLELSAPAPPGESELEQIVWLTRSLPSGTPVELVEVARLMADCDMDYQFELGLDLILAGLETRLGETSREQSHDRARKSRESARRP